MATEYYYGNSDDASFCSVDSFFADGGYEAKICPATDLSKELIAATRSENLDRAELLLKAGADINQSEYDSGFTPLCMAIQYNKVNTVKWFLEQPGLDINKPCRVGTPLSYAFGKNNGVLVELLTAHGAKDHSLILKAKDMGTIDRLIKEGADINATNDRGQTALHLACSEPYQDERQLESFVTQLLERGADANARDNHMNTPLIMAATENYVRVATVLLERGGADINAVGANGSTPLLACYKPAMIALLLERGANVNARDQEGYNHAFCYCARSEYTAQALDLLIGAGIDVNAQGRGGETPLMKAAVNRGNHAFRRLLQAGADPCIMNDKGSNALHIAVACSSEEELVELLMKTDGVDPSTMNNKGWNALHVASHHKQESVLELLLRPNNLNVDEPTGDGATALHLAIQSRYYGDENKVIKGLLELGADANATTRNGSTPLGLALGGSPKLETIKVLVDHGADVNGATTTAPEVQCDSVMYYKYDDDSDSDSEDEEGGDEVGTNETPLLTAIKGKHQEIALYLLSKGADPSRTNEKGESPLAQANQLGLASVVVVLLELLVADGSWDPVKE